MTEAQIKHMVDRFLGWSLPQNFTPDGGISFERTGNTGTPHEYENRPSGTNLLDATQAEAMVRYMVDGMPSDEANIVVPRKLPPLAHHAARQAMPVEVDYWQENGKMHAKFRPMKECAELQKHRSNSLSVLDTIKRIMS